MRDDRNQRQANPAAKKQAAAGNQQAQQQYEAAKAESVEAAGDPVLAKAEVTKKNFNNASAVCRQSKDYDVRLYLVPGYCLPSELFSCHGLQPGVLWPDVVSSAL